MEANLNVSDSWVETPRGRLFARSWQMLNAPDAVPLVLFHDSLGCVQLWHDFPAALAIALNKRVIAYDRLGFGQSDRRMEMPSSNFIENEAEEFFPHVRRHFAFERFIAFGHSVGGAMAILCASRFPNECSAVITESAQAFVEDRTLRGIRTAKEKFNDPKQFSKIEKYHGSKADWVLRAWTDIWLSKEFASWSLENTLPRVCSPLLAIHGEEDEYGSLEFPKMITSLSGGQAERLILASCGHVPHKESPGAVLKSVADFLKDK
jgi:pimeloyl-ACP methyl ester carboxylesterase